VCGFVGSGCWKRDLKSHVSGNFPLVDKAREDPVGVCRCARVPKLAQFDFLRIGIFPQREESARDIAVESRKRAGSHDLFETQIARKRIALPAYPISSLARFAIRNSRAARAEHHGYCREDGLCVSKANTSNEMDLPRHWTRSVYV
jgi:hypothetical protein